MSIFWEKYFRISGPEEAGGQIKRIGIVDDLRGVFHIVLLLDHLPFVLPNVFTLLAGFYEFIGYVSVAEGFVFLSGFVSAVVYTKIKREQGSRAVWRKALTRSAQIHLCYIAACVLLILAVRWGGRTDANWASWLDVMNVPLPVAVAKIILVEYQPTFLEILPMYSFLLLITPTVIIQLEKGNSFKIMLISLAVWIGAQLGIRDLFLRLALSFGDVRFGYFNIFAWQILFCCGLLCGYLGYVKNSIRPLDWRTTSLAYCLAVFFFALRHHCFDMSVDERWVGRATLGPMRILNLCCIAILVYRARFYFLQYAGWKGFAFLSKNSLQVFAFHLFPIYIVALITRGNASYSGEKQIIGILFCVASLFAIAFFSKCIKRLRRSMFTDGRMAVKPI